MKQKSDNVTVIKNQREFVYLTILIVLFIIFEQVKYILGVPIKKSMPQLSHAIFLFDKIIFFALFLIVIIIRLVGGFLVKQNDNLSRIIAVTKISKSELIFLIFLALFGIWCLFSGVMNENSLKVTINGAYAYLAYILVFYVFSSLQYTKYLIRKTYLILMTIALFLSSISVFQEIVAFIYPASVNLWPNIMSANDMWRKGLFRAPSLLGHPNEIGIFALFFWTVELVRIKKTSLKGNWPKISILGLAIAFSLSRAAIGGALIALVCLISVRTIVSSLPIILIVFYLFASNISGVTYRGISLDMHDIFGVTPRDKPLDTHDIFGVTPRDKPLDTHDSMVSGLLNYDKYRAFCKQKSLEVFKDHPWLGVGPGMFGGHISIKYSSKAYAQYGFTGMYFDYLQQVGSVEMQWLQTMAEIGAIGLSWAIMLLISPLFILYRLLKQETDVFLEILIIGLMIMPLQLLWYGLGFSIFQLGEWLLPYFTFIGLLVSVHNKNKNEMNLES